MKTKIIKWGVPAIIFVVGVAIAPDAGAIIAGITVAVFYCLPSDEKNDGE